MKVLKIKLTDQEKEILELLGNGSISSGAKNLIVFSNRNRVKLEALRELPGEEKVQAIKLNEIFYNSLKKRGNVRDSLRKLVSYAYTLDVKSCLFR